MKKFLFLIIFLSGWGISSSGACNWASEIKSFTLQKQHHFQQLIGYVHFQERGPLIDASWWVNGRKMSGSGQFLTRIAHNGTFTVCLRLYDRIYKCDTSICDTFILNTVPVCNWYATGSRISVGVNCINDSFRRGLSGSAILYNGGIDMNYYKYEWYLDTVKIPDSDTSRIFIPITSAGTYWVSVRITDTVNSCDTVLYSYNLLSCPATDSFPGWSQAFDSFSLKQHCRNPWFYSAIEAGVYMKPRLNNYWYWYSWSVNGVEVRSSSAHGYGIAYQPPAPGNYQICTHIRDSIAHTDTTICRSIYYNCDLSCKWSSQSINLYGFDTCNLLPDSQIPVFAIVSAQPNLKSFYKYDWSVDGISDPLYNNSDIYTFRRPIGTYTLCVTVTDTLNHCDTSLCKTVTLNCDNVSGIKESNYNSLKIFPNPAQHTINIQSSEQASFRIIDITGRVRIERRIDAGSDTVNISELESGLYFVQLIYRDGVRTARVVKQ